MDTIHVVTAINDGYSKHLAVMLNSLLENKVSDMDINIYIICNDISNKNKSKLNTFANKNNLDFTFLKVDETMFKDFKIDGHISQETYYRILIPNLLDKEIQKVIYLDCDIIVKKDITELWKTNIDNYYLAAVSTPGGASRFDALNIPRSSGYFNAGVMLINLNKWRKYDISRKVIDFLIAEQKNIRFWDQDGMNAVLNDKWLKLSPKWNYLTAYGQKMNNPAIIHYNGPEKPWNSNHPLKDEYSKDLKGMNWDKESE